jgi:hypothetical protein
LWRLINKKIDKNNCDKYLCLNDYNQMPPKQAIKSNNKNTNSKNNKDNVSKKSEPKKKSKNDQSYKHPTMDELIRRIEHENR